MRNEFWVNIYCFGGKYFGGYHWPTRWQAAEAAADPSSSDKPLYRIRVIPK